MFGHLSWIDWGIMVVSVVALRFFSLSTRKYMRGVADFLSANRMAGRYLLTIASSMGGSGTISFVALFEMYYMAGFPPIWWGFMSIPVGIIILMVGWVFYRFRETRALTMAQFFEMRYSRRFRIFAGFLSWACGIICFGIFPAVTAKFFVYFCGLPTEIPLPFLPDLVNVPASIPLLPSHIHIVLPTYVPIMAIDLILALMFVNMGGQVSVMVTECVQGIYSTIAFIVIGIVLLLIVKWPDVISALNTAPPDASMLHPYRTSNVEDFNIWYFLISMFFSFYGYMSWQGTQGFYSSARSPHEQKMGGIISAWRGFPQALVTMMLPIAAFVVMTSPHFADKAATITQNLQTISNEAVRNQMRVPVALAYILPIGIKGLLATVMLFFSFTCHDTYMHSWGSIFIQDVVLPIRKRPLDPQQHIRWLRRSIIGVAVFAFFFSWLYPQSQKILMYFATTATIWAGGAGAVIVGGLYWRKGSTAGAYASLILGASLGTAGMIVPNIYKARTGDEFPINGQWLWMIAMLGAILVYTSVSLLTHARWKRRLLFTAGITAGICIALGAFGIGAAKEFLPGLYKLMVSLNPIVRWTAIGLGIALVHTLACAAVCRTGQACDLEKLLHRGKYRVESDHVKESKPSRWMQIVGITPEFSRWDRILAVSLIVWRLGWFSIFIIVTITHFAVQGGIPTAWWGKFWHFYILMELFIGLPATVWFTIGGIIDIKALFKALDVAIRDHADDGRVVAGTPTQPSIETAPETVLEPMAEPVAELDV